MNVTSNLYHFKYTYVHTYVCTNTVCLINGTSITWLAIKILQDQLIEAIIFNHMIGKYTLDTCSKGENHVIHKYTDRALVVITSCPGFDSQ